MDLREQETLRAAVQDASGAFELYSVTTFKGYRKRKDGAIKEITVEVLDGGPTDQLRYHVVATDEDGRGASGNPANTLDVVLATVHWGDLDRD